AIPSMQAAPAANGDEAPEGSWDPQSVPIPDAGELARDVEARLAADEEAAAGAQDSTEAQTVGAASIPQADDPAPASPSDEGAETPEQAASAGGATGSA
ncbi:MAG: hypothetical protein ACC726_15840, partial [Chloroflexota bacterium]